MRIPVLLKKINIRLAKLIPIFVLVLGFFVFRDFEIEKIKSKKRELIESWKTAHVALKANVFLFLFLLLFVTFVQRPWAAGADIVINTNTTWTAGTYNYGTITVTTSSTLTLQSDTGAGTGVVINADNIIIDIGSSISANGTGFTSQTGPGKGTYQVYGGSGAGYGGVGGIGGTAATAGGVAYGSLTSPIDLGSGSGGSYNSKPGVSGGGAIKLIVRGTLTVNGGISSNGANGASTGNSWGSGTGATGGGAGGSIWVDAETITGNGSINANGGSAPYSYLLSYSPGNGGGGRIAIYYTNKTFSGIITANAGNGGGHSAAAGTIYESAMVANPATSAITYPVNNGLAVSSVVNGTAVAGDNGIQKVQVAIVKTSNGYYYNGTAFISTTTPIWLDTTGTTDWSYTASSSAFLVGSTYYIYSRTQDTLGSYEVPKESYFTYTSLTSSFTNPTNSAINPSTDFVGTSTANSINTIKISIQELDTNKYYNGSTFTSDAEVWINTAGTSTWSYDASGVPFLNGTAYKLRSKAEDLYGTVEAPSTGIVFLKFNGLIISSNTTWSTNQTIDSNGFLVTNNATLTIDNGVTVTNAGPVYISNTSSGRIIVAGTSTVLTGTALKTIGGTVVFDVNKDIITPPTFSSIFVAAGTILTHSANSSVHSYSLILSADNATIDGEINVNYKGYSFDTVANGYGPGGGTSGGGGGSAGGGYGGVGGSYVSKLGGVAYGSIINPLYLGSAGGSSMYNGFGNGGYGGGAIFLNVSNNLILHGSIFANGQNGTAYTYAAGGGGSGGSVQLRAGLITGNGTISANGGAGGIGSYTGAGGAGGRIALYYGAKTYAGIVTMTGGAGYTTGGVGTIYEFRNIHKNRLRGGGIRFKSGAVRFK